MLLKAGKLNILNYFKLEVLDILLAGVLLQLVLKLLYKQAAEVKLVD